MLAGALVVMSLLPVHTASARHRRRLQPGESPNLTLHISVQPGTQAELEALNPNGGVLLTCDGLCSGSYAPGIYRLTLLLPDGRDAMEFRLSDSTYFKGNRANYTLKYVGLGVAILGLVAAASGVSCVIVEALPRLGPHSSRHPGPVGPLMWYGVAAIPVGILVGLVGLALYGSNRGPFEVERIALNSTRIELAVLPTATGVMGHLTAAF